MKLVCVLIFAVTISVAASRLRADVYAFEVKGRVTGGLFLPLFQVQVGDEIAFRYTLDSTDLDPSALGTYRGSTAVFETPAGIFSGDPARGGGFRVHDQIASFGSYLPGEDVSISFRFPPETLLSDELPLSLPVSSAINRSFFVNPVQSFPSIFGTVTSYEARLVPESSSLCLFSVACAVLGRRRT